mgnify:CR=1 FL=1
MANEKSSIEKKIEKPDYAAPLRGGDFLLRELTLTSKSSPINPIKFNAPGVFIELNIYEDLFENVSSTIQLLEICTKCNIKRLIFTSSSSIYGNQKNF